MTWDISAGGYSIWKWFIDAGNAPSFVTVSLPTGEEVILAVDDRVHDPIMASIRRRDTWAIIDFASILHRLRPGDTVIDLGAHIGVFALAAASRGCKVLAVEANAANARLLWAAAECNGFEHVTVCHAVAGDRVGQVSFLPYGPWGMVASDLVLDAPGLINARSLDPVPMSMVTVDDLVTDLGWSAITWVKIDVEGSEVRVLRGMRRVLETSGPQVCFECNPLALHLLGSNPEELHAEFRQRGYATYLLTGDVLRPFDPRALQISPVVNCLALSRNDTGWKCDPPMPEDLLVILRDALDRDPARRVDVAVRLSLCATLPDDPRVNHALMALRSDPHPMVRAALAEQSL